MAASETDLGYLSLPISNEYNKQLEEEVAQKQREINNLEQQISEHNDRIQVLSDHLKNVHQELQLSQALYEARKSDVATEKHLIQVAEREEGRLKDGYRQLKLEQEKLSERMNMFENSIFKSNTKTEEIRKKMNLDQQSLEAWLEESARRDEDSLTIAKYAKADDAKVKELTLKSEQLHDECIKSKHSLDVETTETLTAQIELDKTAESFRNAHKERQQLIFQWEQIIEQMKRRDEDMDRTATELAKLKAELRTMETLVNEKKQFLDDEANNNKELNKRVKQAESQSVKYHLEYQEKEKEKQQLRDELETLKYSVDRTAADLEGLRSQSHSLSKEIKDRNMRLDTLHHQRLIIAEENKKAIQKTLSAEERAQKMDQLLAEEENKVKKLEKEVATQREKQFKKNEELNKCKRKKQSIEAEIQSSRIGMRNLVSKQRMIDEEILKQQELLYMQDFQLQQLEHKMSRLEGERTEEEKTHLNNKIKDLESQWENQHQSETLLRNQLKRLQDDLRRLILQVVKGQKTKETLIGKLNELNLHIDSTKRELKKAIMSKQDLMVDENIIKLEIKRLRDILFSHSDEVVGLEKEKLQLVTAMTERKKEIDVHKDMLKAQIRTLDSERQTVNTELHDRISKIDRLRKRYEILTVSMSSPEEEEHSQTYYVIKAAQEREELQSEGDELDAKIRKAEKEIQALENTLALMNSKNEKFRRSLQHFDPKSDDSIELETLEGQLKAAIDKCRHKKKQVLQLETDIKALNNTLAAVTKEQTISTNSLESTKEQLTVMTKELEEVKTKVERATKHSTKLIKELRTRKGNVDNKTDVEDDIALREIRDFNSNILQQLGKIASNDSNMAATIHLLLSQVGLYSILPSSPSGSRISSLPSSAQSSTTQLTSRSSTTSRQSTPRQLIQSKPLELGITNLTLDSIPRPHSGGGSSRSSSRRSSSEGRILRSKPPSPSSVGSSRPTSSLDLTVKPS